MATISHGQRRRIGKTLHRRMADNRFDERHDHLADDDLHAGYQIPGILTGIVLFGLLSMILSVLVILWSSS